MEILLMIPFRVWEQEAKSQGRAGKEGLEKGLSREK
jgi:hypothetical protein